jgi:hypothetical protein
MRWCPGGDRRTIVSPNEIKSNAVSDAALIVNDIAFL